MKNRWTAALLACAIISVIVSGSPALAQRLYWSKNEGDVGGLFNNILGTVRVSGADFFEIYQNPDSLLRAIAVDSASRKLFWIEESIDYKLVRGDANGCVSLPIEGYDPRIALDGAGGKIYWTEYVLANGNGRIRRADLDLSSVELVLDGLSGGPREIGIDSLEGKIYWYKELDGEIMRSNLDGSNVEFQFEVATLRGMQVDPLGQKIYWADWSPGTLRRANYDGSDVEQLAPQVKTPFVVDTGIGAVYWQAADAVGPYWEGAIKQVDLDGSNERFVMTGIDAASSFLALDPSNEVITLQCGVLVPALGVWGAGALLLLLLLVSSRVLVRRQVRQPH